MFRLRRAAFLNAATVLVALIVLLPLFLTGCDDFILYEQFPLVESVGPPPLAITPTSAELVVEETITFSASGGTGGYEFTVVESNGGTIVADGTTAVYTAPSLPGSFTVRVADAGGSTASAEVTVTSAPQPLAISPATKQVQVGGTALFTASGGAGGYAFSVLEAEGGSVEWSTDTAVYTAPSAPGEYSVRVTDSQNASADAHVEVIPEHAPLAITPTVAAVNVGGSLTFVGSGGAGDYVFTIESGPGTVHPTSGVFNAGTTAGETTVRVTDSEAQFAEATVIVIENQELYIVPESVTISVDSTYQFGSVGGTGDKTFDMVSGDGSMSTDGLYSAPSIPTTDQVEVVDDAGNRRVAVVYVVDTGPLGISPLDPEIEEGSSISFSGFGGSPPYEITIESGPPTFDPATDTYTASSSQVGFDLVTISITDDDSTTLETHITIRPATPTDLAADGTYPGPKTIELTWTDRSSAETGYRIERKKGHGGTYTSIVTLPADTESYLDDDALLEPNNLYVYRVIAEAATIESFPSAEASDLANAVP